MKKGIFLPMLALFTILAVSIIAYLMYERQVDDKTKIIGEKAGEIIKTILEREKIYFNIQESAKLAYCDALNTMSQDYRVDSPDCIQDSFPLWDFTPNCNPLNVNFNELLTKSFKENFDYYLMLNNVNLKYEFLPTTDGFSLTSESTNLERNSQYIEIKYPIKVEYNKIIESNQNFYDMLITKAKNYKDCIDKNKDIDTCNYENQIIGRKSDKLIKFEVPSNKNPCTSQEIRIKFAIFAKKGP